MQNFSDTGLSPAILTALTALGFEKPTPIQQQAIPHILSSDNDLVALAQTGTGKTAAFSLPVIQQIDPTKRSVQALILCPTRELCLQIMRDIETFIKFVKGVSVTAIYGGEFIGKQIKSLSAGVQIVVGTPGRVNDLLERGNLKLGDLQFLVLDEADEMLNMGFKEELDRILTFAPEKKQTLLFSATMPRAIADLARKYMKNPDRIEAKGALGGADNISHLYYMVHAKDRYEALRRIADSNPNIYGIIFCRTRLETADVADKLIADNYSAEAIHGDISQNQREQVMDRFRRKQTQFLIATDVAARGIDVDELTHVINYQLPDSTEAYIHRSGRTGRAGNSGTSLSIVNMKEQYRIRAYENKVGKKFEQMLVPSGAEICEKQLFALIDKMKNVNVDEERIAQFLPAIEAKLSDLSREELVKKFVSVEFNRFLNLYRGAADLNVRTKEIGRDRARNVGGSFSKFSINLGNADGMTKKHLFMMVNKSALKGAEVGDIGVSREETTFEIETGRASQVMGVFRGLDMNGKKIIVKDLGQGGGGRPQGGGGRPLQNFRRGGSGGGYGRR